MTPWLLLVGAGCIAAAVLYTGGPKPYGYSGLGEVMVLAFFGFVATAGSAYVQLERVPGAAWWGSLAVGLLACAILLANNIRDIVTDAVAGKRTLAVRLGDAAAGCSSRVTSAHSERWSRSASPSRGRCSRLALRCVRRRTAHDPHGSADAPSPLRSTATALAARLVVAVLLGAGLCLS